MKYPFAPHSLRHPAVLMCGVLLVTFAVPAAATHAASDQDITAIRSYCRDPGVDVSGDRVHLTRSFLIEDEIGNTDYRNVQPLTSTMWARKTLALPYSADGDLIFYGSADKIVINGHVAPKAEVISSTAWSHVPVPAGWLHAGSNEVIFSGPGQLLLENSVYPDRSARSLDAGKTWNKDQLGPDGVQNGEFCVRLRLNAYAPEGTVTSEPVNLFNLSGARALQPAGAIQSARVSCTGAEIPGRSALILQARAGKSPRYDPGDWSSWQPVRGGGDVALPPDAHYLQWRALLSTSDGRVTPSFQQVRVGVDETVQPLPANVKIEALQDYPVEDRSYPFAYQHESPRLAILRDKYHLKDVIAPGKTELEQMVLLRNWVRNQWPDGWAHDDLDYTPPWNALVILDMAPREQALGMCTHYSTVFVQCALSLGFTARQLILDHHCAAEIWSDQFGKWIVMDTGNSEDPTKNCYFAKDGVPLNALEIHNLWENHQEAQINVVYAPPYPSITGAEMIKNKVNQVGFDTYVRFSAAFRNDHLDSPFPGELEQGEANYFYDGYLWWQDGPVPTHYPEYSHLTDRPQDLYWNLNEVQLDLQAAPDPDKVKASFATDTPNFDHYLVRVDGGTWVSQRGSVMTWPLHQGTNHLEVKVVNSFGREGRPSSASLEVGA